MNEKILPYPYPQDINGPLRIWGEKNNIKVPSEKAIWDYQLELLSALTEVFPSTLLIKEDAMLATAQEALSQANRQGLQCISLDDVYMPQLKDANRVMYLDLTRLVDRDFRSIGLGQRSVNSTTLERQLAEIKAQIGNKKVLLYDDVAWEGSTLERVINLARQRGIEVTSVITAIGVGEAESKIARLQVPYQSVFNFPEVIDTVNERDFLVGAPNSGRTIIDGGRAYGAPYLLPLGDPAWASIPSESADQFSRRCLSVAANFWQETERLSGSSIPVSALPKPPIRLTKNSSVSRAIQEIIN